LDEWLEYKHINERKQLKDEGKTASLKDKNPPNKVGNFMSVRSDINIPTKRKRNGKNEVPKYSMVPKMKNKNSHTGKKSRPS
jgi:hypothetical protein